jgi:hypothetical protein
MVFKYYRYRESFEGACVDYMYLLGDDRWIALRCYTFAGDDLVMVRGELELKRIYTS